MFDNNPFREYKNMIKKKRLSEEDHNMGFGPGAADNYDAEKEHGEHLESIGSELKRAVDKEGHNRVHELFRKHYNDLTPEHLDMITSVRHLPGNIGYSDLVREVPLHPSATDNHRKWAELGQNIIGSWASEPSQLRPGSRITD